jgi:hypothetical protein
MAVEQMGSAEESRGDRARFSIGQSAYLIIKK